MKERQIKKRKTEEYEACYVCEKCGYGSKEKITNINWIENHEKNCNGIRPVKKIENRISAYKIRG
jgi:hypothetical protein